MKKLLVLLGVGVGIVVGSRLGRAPYEKLRGTVRGAAGSPEVAKAVDAVSDKVDGQAVLVHGITEEVAVPPT
jgi:hypothetical protein